MDSHYGAIVRPYPGRRAWPHSFRPKEQTEYTMRVILTAVFLLTTTLVDGAIAADAYRYTTHYVGYPEPKTSSGNVLVDGSRYRIQLGPSDDPRPWDVFLSMDGGRHQKAVNLGNKTFFDLPSASLGPTSLSYRLLPVGDPSITNPKIESSEENGEILEGYPTRKVIIRFSYNVQVDLRGTTIRGKVQSTTTFWLTDRVSPPLLAMFRPQIRTGFPEIDDPLAELLSELRGFSLKGRTSITTEVSGEEPETSVRTRTVDAIRSVEVKPEDFQVPKGFIYQEPVWATPGGGKVQKPE